ncbi:MAG TPA: glycosyltransferase family 4 protein [Candidatus Paceibacterota bacterium]|nr:glycosyltransferase family 4 protein [Candidatus Paceibacterota bacterium]
MRILTLDYRRNLPHSPEEVKTGTERFARDFAAYATEHGHEWIGIVAMPLGDEPRTIPGAHPGVQFTTVDFGNLADIPLEDHATLESLEQAQAAAHERLATVVRDARADLMFLNGFSHSSWMLYRAGMRAGVPIVIQHAGIFVRELEAHAHLYPASYIALARAMELEAARGARANVFLNEHSRRAFIESVGSDDIASSVIIPLPHAGWAFRGTYAPSAGPRRRIGAVARWDRIKNHEAILAFAEEAARQDMPWEIVVVTTIPDTPKRAAFKQRYRSVITVVDRMERTELADFYRSLDALVLPSHFETAGGVVMEALAEGKPTLIAPQVGWVDEYRELGMSHWITDFSNPAVAVAALTAQFAQPAWPELERFAAYVQSTHNPEHVFTSYLDLFSSLA